MHDIYKSEYVIGKEIHLPYPPKLISIEAKRNSAYDGTTKITRIYFFKVADNQYFGIKTYIETGNSTHANIQDVSESWYNYFVFNNGNLIISYDPKEGGLNSTEYQTVEVYY